MASYDAWDKVDDEEDQELQDFSVRQYNFTSTTEPLLNAYFYPIGIRNQQRCDSFLYRLLQHHAGAL